MLDTFVAGLLVFDLGIQVVMIDRIVKVYQRNKLRDEHEEEETLLRYESLDQREPQKGWEFKILRASYPAFRDRKTLREVCEEEAQAGWILLEKLDDRRLRFRRPLSARDRDRAAKIDPYRSQYGLSSEKELAISIGVLLVLLAIPAYFGYELVNSFFRNVTLQAPPTKPTLAAPKPPAVKPAPTPAKAPSPTPKP